VLTPVDSVSEVEAQNIVRNSTLGVVSQPEFGAALWDTLPQGRSTCSRRSPRASRIRPGLPR
jgi:hypothetical protein